MDLEGEREQWAERSVNPEKPDGGGERESARQRGSVKLISEVGKEEDREEREKALQ